MRSGVRRVVVTGSESTGKTTLAAKLARHYATIWSPEYSRIHAESKRGRGSGELDASDVEPIAVAQIATEDDAIRAALLRRGAPADANAPSLVIHDTDLVSTVIYSRHYYGACPPWIEQAARERRADLYLVCDIDVPWLPDAVRDRPHQRAELHAPFVAAVESLGAPHVLVSGDWDRRFELAVAAVDGVLSGR